jgi:hypothetical protein
VCTDQGVGVRSAVRMAANTLQTASVVGVAVREVGTRTTVIVRRVADLVGSRIQLRLPAVRSNPEVSNQGRIQRRPARSGCGVKSSVRSCGRYSEKPAPKCRGVAQRQELGCCALSWALPPGPLNHSTTIPNRCGPCHTPSIGEFAVVSYSLGIVDLLVLLDILVIAIWLRLKRR